MQKRKYYAFISYKRQDEQWAEWVQKRLEHYRFPTTLNGREILPKELRPIFRDVTDLTPAPLEQVIAQALDDSEWLVVICSPRAAQSQWVSKEAQAFIDSGRADHIIPFIIEGSAFSNDPATECYPEALLSLRGNQELLGANINEAGRDSAVVKVVARMFGLSFDSLWQRHERERRRRRRLLLISGIAVMLGIIGVATWIFLQNRKISHQNREILIQQEKFYANRASQLLDEGDTYSAMLLLNELTSPEGQFSTIPLQPEAEFQMRRAASMYDMAIWKVDGVIRDGNETKFSPGGTYLYSKDAENCCANFWYADTYTKATTIQLGDGMKNIMPHEITVSHDDSLCAYVFDNKIRLYDIESGSVVKEMDNAGINNNSQSIYYGMVSFTCDDKYLIYTIGYNDINRSYICVYDIINEEIHCGLETKADHFNLDRKNNRLIAYSTYETNTISLIDWKEGKVLWEKDLDQIFGVVFLDEDNIIVANSNGLDKYNLQENRMEHIVDLPLQRADLLSVIPDDKQVLVSFKNYIVLVDPYQKRMLSNHKSPNVSSYGCLSVNNGLVSAYAYQKNMIFRIPQDEKNKTSGRYGLTITMGGSRSFRNEAVFGNDSYIFKGSAITDTCGKILYSDSVIQCYATQWLVSKARPIVVTLITKEDSVNLRLIVMDGPEAKFFNGPACDMLLALSEQDGTVLYRRNDSLYEWNYQTKEELCFLSGSIKFAGYSSDGKRVLTIDSIGTTLTIYDHRKKQIQETIFSEIPFVYADFAVADKSIVALKANNYIYKYCGRKLDVVDSLRMRKPCALFDISEKTNRILTLEGELIDLKNMKRIFHYTREYGYYSRRGFQLMASGDRLFFFDGREKEDGSNVGKTFRRILSIEELSRYMMNTVHNRRLTQEEKAILME